MVRGDVIQRVDLCVAPPACCSIMLYSNHTLQATSAPVQPTGCCVGLLKRVGQQHAHCPLPCTTCLQAIPQQPAVH
jgi:hypothetical protein